ncbi:MAG: N-acetyltransferase [Chloroflexota bacterium]|nr:N-acetyltransferase [Chloroflexota bacterium]
MSASVTENPELNRYEIREDDQLAGFLSYSESGGTRDFSHTEVDQAFSGRGLASKLVRGALDDARAKSVEVVPSCSVVKHFVGKNPEYLDVLSSKSREQLEAGA